MIFMMPFSMGKNSWILLKKICGIYPPVPAVSKITTIDQLIRSAAAISAVKPRGKEYDRNIPWKETMNCALASAFEAQTYLLISRDLGWKNQHILFRWEFIIEKQAKEIQALARKSKMQSHN